MKTILVVDDDKMILRLATEALRSYDDEYKIKTALNGKQALQILNTFGVDLVLTDLKMPVMDGYELLSHMGENFKKIPIIVMTGFGSPEVEKKLRQKGILHYIEKPFELSVLKEKISAAFEASSKGYIHGFTLANFLQAVEIEQKTTTLKIESNQRTGYLHIRNGVLIDAEAEDLKGESAAIEMLCWDDARIEILSMKNRERSIQTSLMQLLLEASRKKDDESADSRPIEDILEEAIRLAEGHHFKAAQRIIVPFLKENSRNARGWLWYSRIIVNMKFIDVALKNARGLSPENADIAEDIEKVALAKNTIKSDQIRRCPFCWSPVELKVVQCQYCRSHLLIHPRFFAAQKNPNKEVLKKAIERYTRVISREKNINAYYYLSMAHLNLRRWEESLNLLHKTVNLIPEKNFFSEQLRTLLNHVASEKCVSEQDGPKAANIADIHSKIDSRSKKKKILVVEDSPTTRKVISITLGQKGYQIIEAKDGLEALSMLNENHPDLVLLDIILPKMDGYKILEIIKNNEEFKNIPVIMLTSRDGVLSRIKGRLSGSTAYLTKPFEPKNLVETVEKYI